MKVTVNSREVKALFDELEFTPRQKAQGIALDKSSKVLIDEARKNLRNISTNSGPLQTKSLGKYNQKLEDGILRSFAKNLYSVTVHIMGDYRLRWFELGTRKRYTKGHKKYGYYSKIRRTGKGGFRGRIKAFHFFNRAKYTKEREVFTTLQKELDNHIEQVDKKHK